MLILSQNVLNLTAKRPSIMTCSNSRKGSEWRRWDLHVHTPETKLSDSFGDDETVWDRYIDILEDSSVQAFGITDYFSSDGYFNLIERYRKKHPNSNKVFFLNIEFRLVEAISSNSSSPHMHVIFDNEENVCSKSRIDEFLFNLKTSGETENGVPIPCADLKTKNQFSEASISLEGLQYALNETFGEDKPYLLAFPAKNDGVKSTDSTSPRKILITDKIDKMCDLFLGDAGSKKYFLLKSRYKTGESLPKPVISGSDAHSFDDLVRLEGNVFGFEPTWIKSDLTFRGLKQICFEPDARVFIGSEPPVEIRKAQQATKFISELKIDQCVGYDESNGRWFKNIEIPFNPGLTVIIGNKGSCKSALVDIIGLLGGSRQEEYFSFLSNKGSNKQFKQRGYAENFMAKLTWQSSDYVQKQLDETVDVATPEAVRYLPQNYFEQLTNDIEIKTFRREIEEVVFSHVEKTDRMEKSTFEELQEFKTQQSKKETSYLKSRLRQLNIEIVNLEEQADPLYKKQLDGKLKAKRDELTALEKVKPQEVDKPGGESKEQKQLSDRIKDLTTQLEQLRENEQKTVETIAQKKNKLQKLTSLLQSVIGIRSHIDNKK